MNSPLLTDLYQLSMGYGYWQQGRTETRAVFHLFFRHAPFGEQAAIACGIEPALDYLCDLRFTEAEIEYLQTLLGHDGEPLFSSAYLDYLANMEWQLTVKAVPEGSLVFPHEPLLQVEGPLLQVQLVETALLNLVNFQTLIATKAARICEAAEGDPVMEFGLRRAQGPDGALSAARAAYIGGCVATSNVLAGMQFDIPVKGTHAHSWVMSHEDELEAFQQYAEALPNNTLLLVDTYDTLEGVKKAIQVGLQLRSSGHDLIGIRLDSGDLTELSIQARHLLDDAGFPQARIVASNDLDEYTIRTLKKQGAKIDTWGVGTKLATAYDQPALGGVYKLSAIHDQHGKWQYRVKLSEDLIKVSNPGKLQVARQNDAQGVITRDILYNELETEPPTGSPLLQLTILHGQRVQPSPTIHETRDRAIEAWRTRPNSNLMQLHPQLEATKQELINQNRG